MFEHHPYGLENPVFDFLGRFEDKQRCFELIEAIRWPTGYICPKCSGTKYYSERHDRLFECASARCRYQCSLTSGTVFHNSPTLITKWFMAIFYVSKSQTGISAEALSKLIFVHLKTARNILRKLRIVMETANQKRFANALFYKIRLLNGSKGARNIKVAIFIQEEPNNVRKVIFQDPMCIEDIQNLPMLSSEDPVIAALVACAVAHLERFFLGTYHHFCPRNFQLFLAEFNYRFNEPDPLKMIRKLLSDCIGVPFDENSVIFEADDQPKRISRNKQDAELDTSHDVSLLGL